MNAFSRKRRSFFQSLSNGVTHSLRPPWAINEYQFVEICKNCTSCYDVCPEQIIEFDSRNQPFLNFQKGECSFCAKCVDSCPSGALLKENEHQQPWNAKVTLMSGCLAESKTLCRSCGDICEHDAIQFPLSVQGISKPEINSEKCTGCGACVAICPTQALNVCYVD